MENPVAVHVVHGPHKLVHVRLDVVFRHVVASPTDQLVDVHVHELEDQRQAPRGLVVEHFEELNNVTMRRQSAERLDLPEVVDLVD